MKLKLNEIGLQSWIIIAFLLIAAVVIILLSRKKKVWTTNALVHGAICISLSFVLSYIRLFKLPQGGSVTPASMLPVMAFSYLYGVVPGLLVSLAYSLLQLLQNPEIFSAAQAILDYPLAFGFLALAGLGRLVIRKAEPGSGREFLAWFLGILFAVLGRYVCHVLSGYIFFANYAPENMNPLVYTLLYNSFVLVEGAICVVIVAFVPVRKALRKLVPQKIAKHTV